jgi:hypothetical protein
VTRPIRECTSDAASSAVPSGDASSTTRMSASGRCSRMPVNSASRFSLSL